MLLFISSFLPVNYDLLSILLTLQIFQSSTPAPFS